MGKTLTLFLLHTYRFLIKPIVKGLGFQCHFTPTCSQYTIDAVQKYGVIKGLGKGLWRVARCNPYNHNIGYDPA